MQCLQLFKDDIWKYEGSDRIEVLGYRLIELENEGWKFTCDNYDINIDNGLYFGIKNSFTQNQNIFISGVTQKDEQIIHWEFSKI